MIKVIFSFLLFLPGVNLKCPSGPVQNDIVIDDLKGVNLEIPPDQFDFDLSCNIAMVLGKKNKINPKTLALKLKDIFMEKKIFF